jgi:hypothetical protein
MVAIELFRKGHISSLVISLLFYIHIQLLNNALRSKVNVGYLYMLSITLQFIYYAICHKLTIPDLLYYIILNKLHQHSTNLKE